MKSIIKFNVLDCLKTPMYYLTMLFNTFVFLAAFLGSSYKLARFPQANDFLQYFSFVMQFSCFLMMFLMCVIAPFIQEKLSNRLELYLANGVGIKKIYHVFYYASFLLAFVGVLFFDLFMLLAMAIFNRNVLPAFWDTKSFLLFVCIAFLCFEISKTIVALIMIIKKPSTIRSVLNIALIVLLYGGSRFGGSIITMAHSINFIILLCIAIFIFALVWFCINIVLEKQITSEKIILSLKQ